MLIEKEFFTVWYGFYPVLCIFVWMAQNIRCYTVVMILHAYEFLEINTIECLDQK